MEKRKTCKSVLFYPTLKPKDKTLCKLPVARAKATFFLIQVQKQGLNLPPSRSL